MGRLEDSDHVPDIDGVAATNDGFVAVALYRKPAASYFDGTDWARVEEPPMADIHPEFVAVGATDDTFVSLPGALPRRTRASSTRKT